VASNKTTIKRIGWAGFVDGKPDFGIVIDSYVDVEDDGIPTVTVYERKKDARLRYQDVREVFVRGARGSK
jgi:hypothetical protein